MVEMNPLRIAVALLLAAPPGAQAAESGEMLICSYATECYEERPCTFTQFGHDVALPAQLPGSAAMLLGTGPAEGRAQMVNDVLVVTGADSYGAYMLTSTAEGFARLSMHFADPPLIVTYQGTCVVPE